MFSDFARRAGLPSTATPVAVVEAVRSIPYGRPAVRSVDGVLDEWRGTCSTKHALLAAVLFEQWPRTDPRTVHRVYHLTPEEALAHFGENAAAIVPAEGIRDVHRYLTVDIDGRVTIDITFPDSTPIWDGRTSMPLCCGSGTDYVAGADPDADKRELEAAFCDPAVRERFIAALSTPEAPTVAPPEDGTLRSPDGTPCTSAPQARSS